MNLVKRLFGGSKQDPQPAGTGVSDRIAPHFTAKLDDNRRIYAIGDIHGRLDLLDRLHEQILEDLETAPPGTRSAVVYLGDYIDRGPASRQVIDRLLWDPIAVSECIHLCGNHDDFLLKFLEDPSVGPVWLRNGGDATLASYKVEIQPTEDPAELRRIRDQLQDRLPEGHRDFLRRLRYSYSEGDYFFAHAGVRPGTPLEAQTPYDLMWIRDEFLLSDKDFGKVVVHGHTPAKMVTVKANQIGIDTGAVWTGRLTAVVLGDGQPRFLSTPDAA